MTRASRRGAPSLLGRLRRVAGLLVSREVTVLTSAVAFNSLLCLFPLLLVLVAAAQRLEPGGAASSGLRVLLQELIPFGGDTIAISLRQLTRLAHGLEVLSLLLIAWGASGIFIPVEMVLNRVWGGRKNRSFWKSRVLAFVLTVAGATLVLLSVALTILARGFGREWPLVTGLAVKALALALSWTVFVLVYRVAPEVRVGWGVAARAAVWAAVVWEASKYAFVWNLSRMQLQTLYGPLAFSVALVLWAFVSSLVLVFGAAMAPAASVRAR